MYTYLHKIFNKYMIKIINFKEIKPILIAISGGQDSLSLVKLIQDFQKNHSINIQYIYIDHQWKKDSKYQIKHLINYINSNQNKIFIYQIKKITFSELEARQIRYQILIKHALKNKINKILTAHTQTDQIETFLQQLIRGSTIDGSTSLTFYRKLNKDIALYRPLIRIKRIDIHWFCRKFCLPVWSDITNYNYKINRNKLRNELIPYLSHYYISNIEKNIYSFIQKSKIDNEYIKQNTIKLYLFSRHQKNIALNIKLIKKQHLSLQQRTLQIFFYHNFNKLLNRDSLFKIINLIQQNQIYTNKIKWEHLTININNYWIYIN
uniref:tRNA(Ile)-lysidine synthase n=1 Tax=Plocamium cartilagineum TaxID=31452 RepID=A0A1C9CHU0_PLOCA|nr:tRNA(Ile)-lysidine synthase [Plocamium cartilagineum]AOM67927.1 tRNA(Ile)-lysidine synthase [Plocamium cartilagineum]